MTATITEIISRIITSNTYAAFSSTFGVITILLLLILLVQKELMRAFDGQRFRMWTHALNIAIAPLLLAFGFVTIVRFLDLLGFV